MSPTDRVRQVLDATPEQQVEIDRILSGRPAEILDDGRGPLLLGMGSAAKLLGCSRTTLWRTIEAGRLEKVELLPGSFRIRRADLLALARGNTPDHAGRCMASATGGAA
jgi:excisionase family DNA binding protein